MEFQHLKFLLKLSDLSNSRAKLTATAFRDFTDKAQISQDLANDGLIAFDGASPVITVEPVIDQVETPQVFEIKNVVTVGIAPTGEALLKLDPSQLPISEGELKVLEELSKSIEMLKPAAIIVKIGTKKISATDRNVILEKLYKSGLIEASFKPVKAKKTTAPKVTKTKASGEFQITEKGQDCLLKLHEYFESLRKSPTADLDRTKLSSQSSDAEVLQIIRELGSKVEKDNYLPIFYLRERLPTLPREELDQILYSLVKQRKIKLTALLDTEKYTQKQINAGISQLSGGPLFLIRIV